MIEADDEPHCALFEESPNEFCEAGRRLAKCACTNSDQGTQGTEQSVKIVLRVYPHISRGSLRLLQLIPFLGHFKGLHMTGNAPI
jgi:hypothetical protein